MIFVLDICDSLQQINKLLALKLNEYMTNAEYLCRPVSAIAALDGKNYEGDCVETLYRHLINIAIQDIENLSTFHTEQLCDSLYAYYYPSYKAGDEKESIILESVSESGLTSIVRHTEWKKHLKETIGEYCSSVGSVNNLARGLSKIASIEMDENDETTIKNALNSLNKNKSFEVKVERKKEGLPDWVTKTISITEKQSDKPKRSIVIGINETLKTNSEGHAEILSITTFNKS